MDLIACIKLIVKERGIEEIAKPIATDGIVTKGVWKDGEYKWCKLW